MRVLTRLLIKFEETVEEITYIDFYDTSAKQNLLDRFNCVSPDNGQLKPCFVHLKKNKQLIKEKV